MNLNWIQVSWIICLVYFIVLFCLSVVIVVFLENKAEHESILYFLRRILLFCLTVSVSQHVWLVSLLSGPGRFIDFAADLSHATLVVCAHAALFKLLTLSAETTATVLGTLDEERSIIDHTAHLLLYWWLAEISINVLVLILAPAFDMLSFTFIVEAANIVSVSLFLLVIWPDLLRLHRHLRSLRDSSSSLYTDRLAQVHRRVRAFIAAIGVFTVLAAGIIIAHVVSIFELLLNFDELPYFGRTRGVDYLSFFVVPVYSVLLWVVWPRHLDTFSLTSSSSSNQTDATDADLDGIGSILLDDDGGGGDAIAAASSGGLTVGFSTKPLLVRRAPSTSMHQYMLGIDAELLAAETTKSRGSRNSSLFDDDDDDDDLRPVGSLPDDEDGARHSSKFSSTASSSASSSYMAPKPPTTPMSASPYRSSFSPSSSSSSSSSMPHSGSSSSTPIIPPSPLHHDLIQQQQRMSQERGRWSVHQQKMHSAPPVFDRMISDSNVSSIDSFRFANDITSTSISQV